jgi:glycosyltransferase involved in cell wall biosynthesis
MRVCKIWDAEYPWDIRAEKVCQALTAAGHEVHMVARNRDGRAAVEKLPECTVHRMTPIAGLGAKLNALAMFPAFFNPRWVRLIDRTVEETGAEVILCRDLPLLPTALRVGRRRQLPVVFDMAENYPAMMRGIWYEGRARWSDWLVRNPRLVERVERWAVPQADEVVVVVEESRDRLVASGIPEERITVVSNTPPRAHALREEGDESVPRDGMEIVYLGLLEAPRGIATLIEAVGECLAAGLKLHLTLIGEGRDRQSFEEQARRVDPTGANISFLGYLPNREALDRVRRADVGMIPHYADEAWNSTIPNKLFDYMAAGLPVVASDAIPVKRVVSTTGCGLVFADRDADDLARALRAAADPGLRERLGAAGRQAIRTTYNWEQDSQRLLEVLERAVQGRGSSAMPAPPQELVADSA